MRGCLFILLVFSLQLLRGQDYSQILAQIDRKCDSLSAVYGALPEKDKELFRYSIAAHQQQLFAFNEIDKNEKFEKYLLEVYKKIKPGSTNLPNVYIYKSSYPNAFTIFNGDIFFHWAFIADLENEASLAFTMGHEVTHYDASHLYLSHLRYTEQNNIDKKGMIQSYQFEQNQEYFADSVGFVLGTKAGYKWKAGISDFYEFVSLDTIMNYLQKKTNIYDADGKLINDIFYNDLSDTLFRSHPPTNSRINKWNLWGAGVTSSGKEFIVSDVLFKEFQEYCREKTLEYYLQQKDYRLGLIKAFKYYCLHPENKKFKYYLLEFLRRKLSLKSSLTNTPFLADIFSLEEGKSIYSNLRWVFRSDDDLKKVKSKIIPLITFFGDSYKDLLQYLTQKIENEYEETYLSMALLNYNDEVVKNKYLEKYLSFENIQYKDFAIAFRDGELAYKFRENKDRVFIYKGTDFYDVYKEGMIMDERKSISFERKLSEKIYSFVNSKKYKQKTYLWNEYNLAEKGMYEGFSNIVEAQIFSVYNSEQGSTSGLRISNSSDNIFLLAPELWTFLYRYKIAEISVIGAYVELNKKTSLLSHFYCYLATYYPQRHGLEYYYDKSRYHYFISSNTLVASDLKWTAKRTEGRSFLTPFLLTTEIYFLMK